MVKSTKPAAQVAVAKKAAALKAASRKRTLPAALVVAREAAAIEAGLAADIAQHQYSQHAHGARAPPSERLLDKREILQITGATFPTIWLWMQHGQFPRGRVVGGKTKWLSSEIGAWLAALPMRGLKGDKGSGQ